MKKLTITAASLGVFILLFYFLFIGREIEYRILKLPYLNPTEYVYPASIDSILNVVKKLKPEIVKEFNEDPIASGDLVFIRSDSIPENLKEFITINRNENINDVIYCNSDGESPLFISNEKRVPYWASYLIHLDSLGNNKTRVSIKTIHPSIEIKKKPVIQHAPGFYNFYEVAPTTIEEYKILRLIGKKLQIDKTMPPLVLPDPDPEK